jgi:hypothetical protein
MPGVHPTKEFHILGESLGVAGRRANELAGRPGQEREHARIIRHRQMDVCQGLKNLLHQSGPALLRHRG